MCSILADVLGRPVLDDDANFRRLGGDSLRAVKAVGRIAVEFGTSDETNEQLLEALLDGADAAALALLVDDPHDDPSPAVATRQEDVLSYGEERVWLAQRYHPDSAAYHVVNEFRVAGDLDRAALTAAVSVLVARHPALATRYDGEAPRLGPVTPADVDIAYHPDPMAPADALAAAERAAGVPFDLTDGRLVRVRTYRRTDGDTLLLVVVHHIATDGWSMDLIYRELSDFYAGKQPDPVPAGYREFARQRMSAGPTADADAVLAHLDPLPDRVELDRRRQRPPTRSLAGAVYRSRLSVPLTGQLTALAERTRASLHVVLLAAYYLCLARRTGQDDMVLGTVVSGRTQPRHHGTVGFFANTMPIRAMAGPDTTIVALLDRLRGEARCVLTHQDAPLEELAARVGALPDRAHTPLVDAVLVLQNNDRATPEFTGCAVTPVPLHTGTAKFDLLLEITPDDTTGELALDWEYSTDVLDGDDIAWFAATYEQVAHAITEPAATVRSATRTTEAELRSIAAAAGPEHDWSHVDLSFDELADADPGAPALFDGDVTVDRSGLRDLRDRIVGRLVASVRPGDVVVVHVPRSAAAAALLAVWRLGAVPVFVDVRHPPAHRNELAALCGPAAVLTHDPTDWETTVVPLADAEAAAPCATPAVPRDPDDAAWLVATSGSTGTPKITVGTHRGLRNRCAWAWQMFPYARDDVAAVRTPLGFVDAIAEIAVPLLAGVPLAIVPDTSVWDARDLVAVLRRHRATRLLATPSMLRRVLDTMPDLGAAAPDLTLCTCSGEPFDADMLSRLRAALPGCRLLNLYGSSEVAADVTWADVTDLPADHRVPIGRPIGNARVVVVAGDGQPAPPGDDRRTVRHRGPSRSRLPGGRAAGADRRVPLRTARLCDR